MMKTIIRKIWVASVATLCGVSSYAQHTYSGYFLDDYTYRFQMNPAYGNQRNFVAMPVLGDLNLAMRGNLHVNEIFFNRGGKTVLFTNPQVSAGEVMNHISNKNRIGFDTQIDLLSGGWKAWGGYNTVSISAVASAHISVPKAFFSLVKEGVRNDTYDIKDMFGRATAYAQIALNHSRDISQVPGLRVGAAMKFYIGIGNLDMRFNKAELILGEDNWQGITNADIYASVGGFRYKKDYNDKAHREYVSGADIDNFGINGFGMGFDLGADYKWGDFHFSAAVLDLGFISWGKTQWASTNGDREINTDAYIFNADSDAPNSFDNEWDRFSDDLSALYELEDMGELSSRTRAMAATLNFGVDYEFPYYRPLHFGILNSTRINGAYTWNQTRISADVAPVKWVSAGVNLSAGTYGVGFGWLLNFRNGLANFFIGMDHTMGKVTKQFIPLNSNASLNLGLNFTF